MNTIIKIVIAVASLFITIFFASAPRPEPDRTYWIAIGLIIFILLLWGLFYDWRKKENAKPQIQVTPPQMVDTISGDSTLYHYKTELKFIKNNPLDKIFLLPNDLKTIIGTNIKCVENDSNADRTCLKYCLTLSDRENKIYNISIGSYRKLNSFSDGVTLKWRGKTIIPKVMA